MLALLLLAALPFGVKAATLLVGATGYGLQSLYKMAQLAVPVGWRYARGERGLSVAWPVREPMPSAQLLLAGVAIAVGFSVIAAALITVFAPVLGIDPAMLRAGYDERFAVSGMGALGVVVFLSFLNSALEELHFRVWLDREVSKRAGDAVGIAVSASAFACMHGFIVLGLPDVPPLVLVPMVIGLAIVGACWSLLLRRPGGALAAWISHGLTDALFLGWGLFWLGYF